MPGRQRHAKIANEMADRLQRSADVPHWNKSERQTVEEWAEDHEMTFAQAIRRLVELGLTVKAKARPAGRLRPALVADLAAEAIDRMKKTRQTRTRLLGRPICIKSPWIK
jgi:hypothetical protein